MRRKYFLPVLFILYSSLLNSQLPYFYPEAASFNPSIPTPEKFLGYAIGTQHTRHDKIVEYFKELDRLSDRITVQIIGETFEHRQH
jgi:hypothetical protein